jgi:hypothetical protein
VGIRQKRVQAMSQSDIARLFAERLIPVLFERDASRFDPRNRRGRAFALRPSSR